MKIGQMVKIIANTSGHEFEIGEVVYCIGIDPYSGRFGRTMKDKYYEVMYFNGGEYEPIPIIDWSTITVEWLIYAKESYEFGPSRRHEIAAWFKTQIEKQLNP